MWMVERKLSVAGLSNNLQKDQFPGVHEALWWVLVWSFEPAGAGAGAGTKVMET
jgi:hypothetical protein